MPEPDPLQILRILARHRVRFVLIGAAAARVAGAPVVTEDIDVTPATDRANLDRLAAALRDLQARLRSSRDTHRVPFPIDADMLRTAPIWTLSTDHGDLDIAFTPSGTGGYDDLRREATPSQTSRGVSNISSYRRMCASDSSQ